MQFTAIIVGFLGFLIGGLLNVLADDLPYYEWPSRPHYPDEDNTPRPFSAWLGTLAFLTGQRVPSNAPDAKLSWRYPLTEIATALAFALTIIRVDTINAAEYSVNATQTAFWLFYMAMFVLIVVIDIEHHLILFAVTIPSMLVALLDAALSSEIATSYPIWSASSDPLLMNALGGAAIGFGVFFTVYLGGFLYSRASAEIRGEPSDEVAFGYGDVMLSMLCGLILGWRAMIFALFITVFLGAFGAMIFLLWQKIRGGEGGMTTALPYGPYIVIGAIIMLLFSDWVQAYMLHAAYG